MPEIELKPCPFCGNRNLLLHQTEYDKTLWVIMCSSCHSEFTVSRKRPLFYGRIYTGTPLSNHDDVVNAWNRRVDNAALVHAHWKGYHTQEPYCSNCGFTYDHEQGEDAQITDYCGNCGAKMDENEVENLKRCSCGDRHYCPEVEKYKNGKWFIRCHMCHKFVLGNTVEEAVSVWNEGAKTDDET